ncbi:MAG TPA: hypothetical protein VD772_02525 [Anseongella sp.]|nr:hypothetical protein [Anseongella sp.]
MKIFKLLALVVCLAGASASFTSCKVGEDDPFISLRSRDGRLKGTWNMEKMTNTYEISAFDQTSGAQLNTSIRTSFDGTTMRISTYANNIALTDTAFDFAYQMDIEENGDLSYENTFYQSGFGVKSGGEDNWYWMNTDKKKSRVYLGAALQAAATAGLTQTPIIGNLLISNLFSDFDVDGLRNKELKLSFNKSTRLPDLTGGEQSIKITSEMEFEAK